MSRRERVQWAEQLERYRDGLPRIFCCGMPRTGTLSLAVALYHCGIPCTHWVPRTHTYLDAYFARGNIKHLRKTADRLRAWSGLPWACVDDLLTLYPRSWWILTTRQTDSWATSWERHSRNVKAVRNRGLYAKLVQNVRTKAFGEPFPPMDVARQRYEAHNERCRTMPFDRFLELDVQQPDAWEKLVRFLRVPFPHTNQGQQLTIAGKKR